MKVKYTSACYDSSGYAEAARNNIIALHKQGINISVQPISFESFRSDLGKHGKIIQSLAANKNEPVDAQILHMTPQRFPSMRRSDCYNIGYTTWETSSLPDGWADAINSMDEIWVPSQHNVEMFKRSGIVKPILCVPHAFSPVIKEPAKLSLDNLNGTEFVFYSIFQWLERKNPVALLVAYLTEFQNNENVALILKTYKQNPGNPTEAEDLRQQILSIKKHLWLPSYPKLLLISDLMSTEQIEQLHACGDCFVSLTRCEGFGIPLAEAMRAANPVITSNYGGAQDFVQHEKTGYLVDVQETPVYGMPWPNYKGDMNWANPSILHARQCMRELYNNRGKTESIGLAAQKWVTDNLSLEKIGLLMANRLKEIGAQ